MFGNYFDYIYIYIHPKSITQLLKYFLTAIDQQKNYIQFKKHIKKTFLILN